MRGSSRWAALAAVAILAAGCTPAQPAPPPATAPTSATTGPRDFTITTTEKPVSFDPAATTTSAGAIVALGVFQRLMIVYPGNADLKPDAATDCLYTSSTVYECQLQRDLVFTNGHALTASDVKFSIERAYRLGIDRTSTRLLNSLQRVEQVDDLTVRFHLKWADSQFGYALATPAASIVDEESYDPDAVKPDAALPVGSGPYALANASEDALVFTRFEEYKGVTRGEIDRIRLEFAGDSTAVEQRMADGRTDVVWRSLDAAALARLEVEMSASEDHRTKGGFARIPTPPVRMQRLIWNPSSEYALQADLRQVVATSLQADRSLGSLIPPSVPGSVNSYPTGGRPKVPRTKGERVQLTLAYSSRTPGAADQARLLRDRLEEKGGLSVLLRADTTEADLFLSDRPAWVNTAFGWLQPYLDEPLPGSKDKLSSLDQSARETPQADTRETLLSEIQQQAAADLTVLPISLGPETFFIREGVTTAGDPFGPGWQLGLWTFRRA